MVKTIIVLSGVVSLFNLAAEVPFGKEGRTPGSLDLIGSSADATSRDRSPIDLVAFPDARTLFFGMKGSHEQRDVKVGFRTKDGADLSKLEQATTFQRLGFDGTYAFDDFWALSVEAGYLLSEKLDAFPDNKGKTGFGDPTFSVLYRMMDMPRDGYDMNLFLGMSPKLQKNKDSSSTEKGTNGKGRTDVRAGIELGRGILDFRWAVDMSLFSRGKEEFELAGGDVDTTTAYTEVALGGALQWRAISGIAVDLRANVNRTFERKSSDGFDISSVLEYGLDTSLNVPLWDGGFVVTGVSQVWGSANGETIDRKIISDYSMYAFHLGLVGSF